MDLAINMSAESTLDFFKKIKPIQDYKQICELSFYSDVPESWILVVCDIEGSTQAIAEGKYKEVNFIGAATIMALSNALKGISIPYVFGGDGATMLIPSEGRELAEKSLRSLQKISHSEYGLKLRVGLVPVSDLYKDSYELKLGKFSLSKDLSIALFSGNGFSVAEKWVKSGQGSSYCLGVTDQNDLANFEGLECRWESFPSSRGEILTVLLKSTLKKSLDSAKLYQEIIEEIDVICGTKESVSPASLDNLKLSKNLKDLKVEQKIKSANQSNFKKFQTLFNLYMEVLIGNFLIFFKVKKGSVNWGKYKEEVVAHSDYWKFDDTLRFVFDVSAAQKRALLACLESKKREGKIVFGTHSSSAALMTCLIFNRSGEHVHFIDGSEGGYALAALQLKEDLKNY